MENMNNANKQFFNILNNKIAQLIEKRKNAHGNDTEQNQINTQLTKLYNIKWQYLEQ